MQNYTGGNKQSGEESWPFNIDLIEDRTRRNYFSLLPDEKKLTASFGEAFVINKPTGSVGGDGYWLYQKGSTTFLAVFDCEGQGHLASMMTRIYANALKRLIVENSIEFPGSILQFIHREIQSKFRDRENIQLNTGADLGIVKINRDKQVMEYAGARMDLIQLVGDSLQIVQGDKLKIGELFDHKHEYNSVSVDLSKSSKFYLYTDGVTDQQGGPSFKRFGQDNLLTLLRKNAGLTMQDQKGVFQSTLDKWSGSAIQGDDMLMIGFAIQ